MPDNKKKNRLFRLLKFADKWTPVYYFGLIGVAGQNFAINVIVSYALAGLTSAAVNMSMSVLLRTLLNLGIQLLAVMCIMPVFGYAFDSSVKRITVNIRKRLFSHIQRLPMRYINECHSGDLISRMTNDVMTSENAYSWQLCLLVMSIFSGIGSILVILSVDAWLTAAAIIIGLMCAALNLLFIKPIKKASDEVQGFMSGSVQSLTDILAGMQVARMFNLNKHLFAYYSSANTGIRDKGMKRVMYQSVLNSLDWFTIMMSIVGLLVVGSIMILNNKLEFGRLMLVIQMMNGVVWMFSSAGNFIAQLQGSLAGADRIFAVLDTPAEESENAEKNPSDTAKQLSGNVISFSNVSFSYDSDKAVLDCFSVDMNTDEVTALVGMSGSGKSTLFKLLLGFYKPTAGDIRILGRPIQDYSLNELRSLIAYVPQDSYLFSGTIMENIAYGRQGASEEEIYAAAQAAYADDFIRELPDGYATQVGERGAHLSGGQRQRIAIARALLKNAPILLLDEATASLDTESEQQVQKALEVLMKNRTTLVAAHRLSTIQNADRILVMEDGRICEQGTHSELLSLNKVYARLNRMQFADMPEPALL